MSIGMTYNEYWCDDPMLARYYYKAFKIKEERELSKTNIKAWLNGYYNYIALIDSSPTFNSLKPSQPLEYLKQPIALNKKEKKAQENNGGVDSDREELARQERLMKLRNMFTNSAKSKKDKGV